jgi:hypothetical protein
MGPVTFPTFLKMLMKYLIFFKIFPMQRNYENLGSFEEVSDSAAAEGHLISLTS